MYAPYFGLSREPFSIAPDPRSLFMSERHREALAHLLYGLGAGGGFVLLTGEIGTGKTTVCRCFLEQVPPDCNVGYIFNPKLTVPELLQTVCEEFRIEAPRKESPSVKDWVDPLNAFLLDAHARGRNSVLVIDEAQNLSADVLEQLRLLTNLETNERKLLQVILIGQPELRDLLAQPQLEQLAQRVVARYHLEALSPAETRHYVQHRLEAAGLSRAMPFERKALDRVHRLTGGVPRRINLLCDRALLGAYGRSEATVTPAIVEHAAREVFGARSTRKTASRSLQALAWVAAGGVAGAAVFALLRPHGLDDAPIAAAAAVSASAPAAVSSAPAPDAPASAAAAPAPAAPSAATATASAPTSTPVLLGDEKQAWRELARAWGEEVAEGDPCAALARRSLHCFSRTLPLALIRQLDRPGIVTLDRGTARPSYALLTAVGDKSVTLVAGGVAQTVTLAALGSRWNGEWATLWRAPEGVDGRVPDRETAAAMRWVSAQLEQGGWKPVAAGALQQLRAQVRSYQLAQGLPADGVLGPLTFMQLNRTAGVDEPRLRQSP